MMESSWERLEPASALINLLPDLWQTFKNLWWLVPALIVGGGSELAVNLLLVLLFLAASSLRTVIRVSTLRYRLQGHQLEVRYGLISRQHRTIDPSRIQHIEIVRNPFHRLAGLAELRIDTAGEGGTEGLLSAITLDKAAQLQAALGRSQSTSKEPAEILLQTSWLELVGYGLSSARLGMALLTVNFILEGLVQFFPGYALLAGTTLFRTWAGLMLVALAGVWLLSVWQALLKFTGFTLLTTPRGLATESGLFTRTRAEVVLAKVQRVRSEEPLIRRLLGYGSICIETARSPVPGQDSSGMALLPMLGSHELGWTSQLVFPELSLNPWETPLSRPASRALLRELILGSLKWLMLSIALASWLEQPLLLLLTVLGPIVAILDWRRQGWGLTETHLVARSGFFTRTTAILPRKKLQAISLVQDPLERLARLARIQVRVAGAEQAFPVLDEAVARKLFATLTTAR